MRKLVVAAAAAVIFAGAVLPGSAAPSLSPAEAQKIAVDAYIYGYSLVTTEITRMATTNTVAPSFETLQAPLNQIVSIPGYPPATYKGVTAPNADTLYTVGFFDVTKEPVVFSYPNMGMRYFLFPIYDAWTDVIASPGKRTEGGSARNVLITGANWHGAVPAGMLHVASPSGSLFMIGRIFCTGTPADLTAVHALQKNFKLVPLSSFGKPYTPPAGKAGGPYTPKDVVRDVINGWSTAQYFTFMTKQMVANPPVLPRDRAIVDEMARIGIVPGKAFAIGNLDPAVQTALGSINSLAMAQISAMQTKGGLVRNGWSIPGANGSYGTNYLQRADISAYGWGANLPQDANYPNTKVDSTGAALNGSNVYRAHFAKGATPPVNGFWSITMYDDQYYFYPNPLNKLTVSPRDGLKYNADGSLDLYFAHTQPANVPESNWLPAPDAPFILMMRLYWPKPTPPSILPPSNPTWVPPAVVKV
jgi:hypothetical protein